MKKNMKRNRKNEENKKILKAEYNAIRAKQRKEMIKSIEICSFCHNINY